MFFDRGTKASPRVTEAVLDPQTSGGLLISLPARRAEGYVADLHDRGVRPAIVGRVVAKPSRSPVVISVS